MPDHLFIDIETAATQDERIIQDIRDNIKPPGTIKKHESIVKWYKEKAVDAEKAEVSKTSFSGLAGSIVCICFAVNDEPVQCVSVGNSEKDMLSEFWHRLIEENGVNFNPVFVGHNITGFDLRFIFHRCVINEVEPAISLPYNEQPWGRSVFDTLFETMGNNKAGGSLDKIAKAFGIEGKLNGMSGADVNQYFLDGRIDEIVKYCTQDVEVTRDIYKKLNFTNEVGE